ncbi:MAG: hypothetical protein GY862_03110 [Gammaproteobacteria bacterium]|nr:hypothetical protein [Gammaproteobacteria bacterium]
MSNTQAVTLTVPAELKNRLEDAARQQGVSLNNLANYLLTTQLSQLEFFAHMEQRLARKNIPELKQRVNEILVAVPEREDVQDWDRV